MGGCFSGPEKLFHGTLIKEPTHFVVRATLESKVVCLLISMLRSINKMHLLHFILFRVNVYMYIAFAHA